MDQQIIFVTKDMTVGEVIEKYPDTAEIMMSHGLHCFGCSVNTFESVEMGARGHGIPDGEIDMMVQEINDYIAKKSSQPALAENEHAEAGSEHADFSIELTQLAADKVRYLAEQQGKKGYGLRIGVVRGGCSGYMYNMDFEKIRGDDDVVIDQHGVRVFIDQESANMLQNVTVDYVESLQGAGFKISNPNEKASCGCGKSFR